MMQWQAMLYWVVHLEPVWVCEPVSPHLYIQKPSDQTAEQPERPEGPVAMTHTAAANQPDLGSEGPLSRPGP